MNNEQTPEDKKRRRWVLPVIVVALLAAGGYAAYSVSNPSQNAQTAKTSHKKADNDWFSSSSSTKDKKSSKKAKKGDSDPVAAVLGTGSDDTSIIQDGVDSGLSAILPTDADPISKAVALLGHATNKAWIIYRISKKQRNPTIHTGLRCFGVSPIGCAYMLRLSQRKPSRKRGFTPSQL